MLTAAAHAADIDIVCVQKNALGADFPSYIMMATLDNGQVIYYTSADENGWFLTDDVNFDGYADFAPVVVRGARNICQVFYLYNPQADQYEPLYMEDQGFWNYTLNAEKRYITSHEQDGYRDGEIKIYEWQDNALALLRGATVGTLRTVEFGDDGMTERWDFKFYEIVARDYTKAVEGGEIIYRQTYSEDDPQYEEHLAMLNEALWDGLK